MRTFSRGSAAALAVERRRNDLSAPLQGDVETLGNNRLLRHVAGRGFGLDGFDNAAVQL
jgi:hypothetical protein